MQGICLKDRSTVSPLEAIYSIIHGSYGKDSSHFPQVDMMIILDILSTLARSGRMTVKQLASLLNSRPTQETLRKYLKILIQLRFVSVDGVPYHGIARAKNFFEVTEKGREFVTFTARIVSS